MTTVRDRVVVAAMDGDPPATLPPPVREIVRWTAERLDRIVNAGSVGMPFDEPGAHWLLLDERGVRPRTTTYDLDGAAALVRGTTYPDAESFASRWVLAPPGAEASIAMHEGRR